MAPRFLILFLLVAPASAQNVLSIGGLAELVAEKAKESKVVSLVDLRGEVAAGAYLPVWTLHDAGVDYVEAGIGGAIVRSENWRPLLIVAANLPALSGKLWSSEWAKAHIRRTKLPPIYFGPQIRAPLPGDRWRWDGWREWLGAAVSIRVG